MSCVDRRILFVPWGGYGDTLLATPALAWIKEKFPQSVIYSCKVDFYYPLIEFNPHITAFVSSPMEALQTPEEQHGKLVNNFNYEETIFYPHYGTLRPSLLKEKKTCGGNYL